MEDNIWSDPHYVGYYTDMMKERYPENQTEREVNFIEKVIDLHRGAKILDACSGCGRHAISLAKRGYNVTGVDLSEELVNQSISRKNKKQLSGSVEFYQGDITRLSELNLGNDFECVICMASLGYNMTDQDIKATLAEMRSALKEGGWLLIDIINRENLIKYFRSKHWTKTKTGYMCLRYTEMNLEKSSCENYKHVKDPEGVEKEYFQWLRTFTFREFKNLLKEAGFTFQQVYGDYTRSPYDVDSPRMIVVCTYE